MYLGGGEGGVGVEGESTEPTGQSYAHAMQDSAGQSLTFRYSSCFCSCQQSVCSLMQPCTLARHTLAPARHPACNSACRIMHACCMPPALPLTLTGLAACMSAGKFMLGSTSKSVSEVSQSDCQTCWHERIRLEELHS